MDWTVEKVTELLPEEHREGVTGFLSGLNPLAGIDSADKALSFIKTNSVLSPALDAVTSQRYEEWNKTKGTEIRETAEKAGYEKARSELNPTTDPKMLRDKAAVESDPGKKAAMLRDAEFYELKNDNDQRKQNEANSTKRDEILKHAKEKGLTLDASAVSPSDVAGLIDTIADTVVKPLTDKIAALEATVKKLEISGGRPGGGGTEDPNAPTKTRAEFDKMVPNAQMEHIRKGGKVTD